MKWYDELPPGKSWASLWTGYILCAECHGIRRVENNCPACGNEPYTPMHRAIVVDGKETVVSETFMGGEGRYEDWIYLQMLEREWKRPAAETDRLAETDPTRQPSPRAAIVVLFWSYFETRINRLLRTGMQAVPQRLMEDTLQRYSSIGSRLDRLYRVLFESTYWADLAELGFDDIRRHVIHVQERRNAFAHGDPRAIDDALVTSVVDNLKREHEAWIAIYNHRCTSR
jgi:hypothetical protein